MKKILSLIAILFLGGLSIYAQNIAPQATASASTCNTGACATLNDLAYGTCGTQSMWITSSATNPGSAVFIQFTWPTVKVVNKITFFVGEQANRFLGGGTVQAWNGSAWYTVTTFTQTTGVCSYSVNFTAVATTQIRIIDIVVIGTQSSNVNFREIEIYGPAYNNDAGVSSMTTTVACTSPQKLDAVVTNFGKVRLDSFRLSWSVNNVLVGTKYITSSLTTGNSLTVNLDPAYAFTPSTAYNFKVWTSFPNGKSKDSGFVNDTTILKTDYLGTPNLPTVSNLKQCGMGKVLLTGTPDHPGDSIVWYAASTGGIPVAVGKNASGPYITQTTTFYAQSNKISRLNSKLANVAVGTLNLTQANDYGAMVNITAINNIVVDSLLFRLYYATPTNMGFGLYYKTGTYAGFQTNASAWTKINQGAVTPITIGGILYGRVSAKSLFLIGGQGYSFYLTSDVSLAGGGNAFYVTSGAPTVTNVDMSLLTSGSVIVGKFGATSVTAGYLPDLTFIYKKECVTASRLPVTVTVKPRPIGASLIPVSVFEGQFRTGLVSDPDVLQAGKTNTYELIPPTGFTNSGHGSTWYISSIVARTKYNVLVPSTNYTVIPPSGTGAGQLIYKPGKFYEDSLITFTMNYADLGPNFCDSSLVRTIYIAPTPFANFKLPSSACSGKDALIENLCTISKGSLSYMWYFGDGDSSDVNTPSHKYKTTGTYTVRLKTTSDKWNVVKDTSMTIKVEEMPVIKFNIVNRCIGTPLTMNNNTSVAGNGVINFQWKYGDGTFLNTSSTASTTKSYATAGAYKVTLVAENKGCKDSLTRNAYQFVRPKADFVLNYGSCLNEPFKFTNTSTQVSGEYGNMWDFGDNGNIASDLTTLYSFTTAGTKDVKLKVISEFNCVDSIIKQVVVKQSPETDFSFPFACERTPTPFTNKTKIFNESLVSYTWTFDQGSPSNLTNPVVSWTSLGARNVTLKTVLANGCSSEITKKLDVGVQPLVDFEFENQCEGNDAVFTNLTTHRFGEIKYSWTFGDGGTSTVQSPTHSYGSAQTFFVQLNASVTNGCQDSAIKSINITQLPKTCDFDYSRNWSVGPRNFVFTPKGGALTGIKYTWLMGDGQKLTSNAAGISYNFNNSLRYCVTMKATNQADCECSIMKCLDVYSDVDDIRNVDFSVYPNPTTGMVTIDLNGSMAQKALIEVYNTMGQKVMDQKYTESTGKFELNLAGNASGVYTIKIIADGQVVVKQVVVQ